MTATKRDRWRIGTVKFLNAAPLGFGLDRRDDVRLVSEVPSRLSEMLERDELDAALLPVISYFRQTAEARERHRHRPLVIVPGISIASCGPAESVLLFCRADYPLIRHVALDPASQTSNCLVRMILKETYGREPHYRWPMPDPAIEDRESDAFLLIGDAALARPQHDFYHVLDLGLAWRRLTGLPMVYAVWAARESDHLAALSAILSEAKAAGLAARDELAREGAARIGIREEAARRYLYETMHYDLGPEALAGLQRFYRWSADQELAPRHIPLVMAGRPSAAEETP
ncbi:MAG: menaquinone biosynthesis protein [Planctomycetes bacterium]|nr:menaquinone biosynthesis protein [Planctomycetota bacterium]